MGYRSARRLHQRRQHLSRFIDAWGEWGGSRLGLCGHGPRHNWSVLIADAFIPVTGCACCAIWRALFVAAGLALAVAAFVGVMWTIVIWAAALVARAAWLHSLRPSEPDDDEDGGYLMLPRS